MKKQLILLVIALLPCTAFSQVLFDNIWLFGREETGLEPGPRGTEIDFRFSTAYFSQVYLAINFLGSATASICDSTGNLLFYTNGCSIANAAHRGMKDGTGINQPGKAYDLDCLGINSMGLEFGYPTNQGVVILPWPGKKDKYALFHLHKPDPISHQFIQNLKYTVVDMAQDSGLGAVTEKNVQVAHDTFCDMLTAVRHANGRDWWLVLPRLNTGVYYIFLFSPEGVSQPIIQTIGKPNEVQSFGVQATFSPNGKKYANLSWGTGGLQVFDFDRCSGRLSNPVYADFPSSIFWVSGVAFSPGSRFLYCSIGHELHQVDLGGGHSDFDEKIRLVAEYDGYANPLPANFYQLMLAPNGKIYMTTPNGTPYLHVIHHPDSLGLACGFEPRGVTLFADHGFSPPNFPHFRLYDLPGSPCDTLGINGPQPPEDTLPPRPDCAAAIRLWPNPASTLVQVALPSCMGATVQVFDIAGRLVENLQIPEGEESLMVDVSTYPPGIYVLHWKGVNGTAENRRLAVLR